MKNICIGFLLLVFAFPATANIDDLVYEGTWVTINRPLDGTMTAVVTKVGEEKWRGHFYGSWQGRDFSYKVEFTGPSTKLTGSAVIDGARYQWTGAISQRRFQGTFDGDRYRGWFDLKRGK
jgi:hypothetical protein